MVDDAKGKGAGVALGGTKCEARGGLYYLPTILTDVNSTMDIFREEIFGPVVSIIKFKHEEVSTSLFLIYIVDAIQDFFVRVGNETMYLVDISMFFTKSCHCQTYQNY